MGIYFTLPTGRFCVLVSFAYEYVLSSVVFGEDSALCLLRVKGDSPVASMFLYVIHRNSAICGVNGDE